jgi:hypothetical protein
LPVSNCDNNASVRVASDPFSARVHSLHRTANMTEKDRHQDKSAQKTEQQKEQPKTKKAEQPGQRAPQPGQGHQPDKRH